MEPKLVAILGEVVQYMLLYIELLYLNIEIILKNVKFTYPSRPEEPVIKVMHGSYGNNIVLYVVSCYYI